ncbi:MAG: hypothetical protein QX191_09830 [Methylococcaceae bacterium]|jgi:hypothetical protein
MNKAPIDLLLLKKVIQTTQSIEGYKPASTEIIQKVQQLRLQNGIQISPKK